MTNEDFHTQRRRQALHALLMFTIPAAAVFFGVNIYHDLVLLPVANLLFCLGCAGLLVASRRGLSFVPIATAYVVALVAMFLLVIARPDVHPNGYVYIIALPVITYILLGYRLGLWTTAISVTASVIAFGLGTSRVSEMMDPVSLMNAATVTLGVFVVCHFWSRSQAAANALLTARSETDPLTELGNRSALVKMFDLEKTRHERSRQPVSIILIDLDHFKAINDRYGHEVGDTILAEFATLVRSRLRPTDAAFRIGGEEFLVLLPDTVLTGARTVGEGLRRLLASKTFGTEHNPIHVTLSGGIAELGRDGTDWSELYQCADDRLYASKTQGRNRVLSVA